MKKQTDCARFERLQDRRLANEGPLSKSDLAFLADHGQQCPACGLERAGLEGLARVGQTEQPSDLSDAEVSRAVEHILGRAKERAPQRRPWLRPLPVGLAAAAAAVVLILLFTLRPGDVSELWLDGGPVPPARSRLTLVVGQVHVDGQPVTALSHLAAGQRVRVAPGGRAVLSFDDGTAALLSDRTDLTLSHTTDGTTRFALKRGTATFLVAPRAVNRPVEVLASWGRIEVVGTVFRVTDRASTQRVQVSRGRVRVQLLRGAPVLLRAGQQLDASGVRGRLDAPSWRRLRAAAKLVRQLPSRGGGVLVVHARSAVQIAVDNTLVGQAPVALVLKPGLRSVAAIREGRAWAKREVALTTGQRTEVRFDLRSKAYKGAGTSAPVVKVEPPSPVLSPVSRRAPVTLRRTRIPVAPVAPPVVAPTVPPPVTPPAPVVETVGHLLSKAARLRAQRSWTQVVGVYRRIIQLHPGAPEAATCLVLMGQVQLRQLRQATGALASFGRYLRLRRSGALAPEAAWGRIESLRQLGRRAAERQACQALLKRYPKSIYAARVRSRLRVLGAAKMGPK